MSWDSFQIPRPGPPFATLSACDQALVRVEACAIGLLALVAPWPGRQDGQAQVTVLNWMPGDLGNDPALLPRVPGHEIVGRVEVVAPEGVPAVHEALRAGSLLGRGALCWTD